MEKVSNIITTIKIIGAAICSTIGYYFGGFGIMLQILIYLTILDYITGVLRAIYQQKLSSAVGYKGIVKKIGIYVIVCLSYLLDRALGSDILLRTATIGFYITVEAMSILENWGGIDLPLPEIIKNTLEQLKNKKGGN